MRQSTLAVAVALSVVVVPLVPATGVAAAASPAPGHDATATPAAHDERPGLGSDAAASPASHAERPGPASAETSALASELRFGYVVALTPDRPGSVRVEASVRIPDSFTAFDVGLPAGAELVAADGFDRGGDLDLTWDGSADPATVTYTVPANRSSGSFDGLEFVDAGPWALVNLAAASLAYRGRFRGDRPTQVETFAVAGEGYAGSDYAYLGAHETTGGPDGVFALVVPATAEMRADPTATFGALAAARDQLAVGARGDWVNLFVGPSPLRSGGTAANASGPSADVWVSEGSRLDTPDSVWIHEYVHTRQKYRPRARMAWFDEASAEYYAAVLALRQGRATWAAFRNHVGRAEEGVLADETTWESARVEYSKGALVLAALDARIRRSSGGDATLMDVFRVLNGRSGTVGYADFQGVVADAAGTRLDGWLDRYVLGSDAPDLPSDPAVFTHPSGTSDPDGDGLDDAREADLGTNPFVVDTDGDGLDDGREVDRGTDPTAADTDGDGLPDGPELASHDTDPNDVDTDGDGLEDGTEVDQYGTDPTGTDSDGDGLADGVEVRQHGTDPTDADTDGDGLVDGVEVAEYGSDPTTADTDGDGLTDGEEANDHGSDPITADTDGDGLADGVEVTDHGTDPSDADTDGDGYGDGREVDVGADPTSATGTIAFWLAVLLDALGLVAGRALPAAYLA